MEIKPLDINDFDDGINFSVDAGLINRLGKELVGRAETAVSELVKNSYDADANNVELNFINTNGINGTLIIKDDGIGMNLEQLINGFMRLSSSDKLHNPVSPTYQRQRAGRKGIGRFATHRLGNKLTIITKTTGATKALQLVVDWNKYRIDTDLTSVFNPISEIDVDFNFGTKLIIEELRDPWSESQIKRVFRYVSDLLQPDFLSDRSTKLNIASKNSIGYFNVSCIKSDGNESFEIASMDKMIFDNALGVIEGYLLDGKGICEVVSKRFEIDDTIEVNGTFGLLKDVHFKVYYFIYNFEWYEGYIPKMEYHKISDLADENGGIKLYRNGFRVLPYGEKGNDWINIEKTQLKTQDNAYVPFSNNNFFGFVEIIDKDGKLFEETSSREGLIENDALTQLTTFVNSSLRQATLRINSARYKEKQKRKTESSKSNTDSNTDSNTESNFDHKSPQEKLLELKGKDAKTDSIIDDVIHQLEESEMLRVLAGIGLNIAEFTHEIRQFIPSFNGSINFLIHQDLSDDSKESLLNLKENFNRFKTYTSYIDNTITQNVNREKQPQNIRKLLSEFKSIISFELNGLSISFEEEFYGFDLYTRSMHPSEWSSILYNLYTNSKKAIKRADEKNGRIKIICGRENNNIYLEFMDNGDGIPLKNRDRIFDAFFTTSTPATIEASRNESITGTGLGLKIVKDIILAYNGDIYVMEPESNFKTCIRIEVPEATEEIVEKYGN
jgi:signal transduction histidine kinase